MTTTIIAGQARQSSLGLLDQSLLFAGKTQTCLTVKALYQL